MKLGYLRFGSKADICSAQVDVRFTPISGHVQRTSSCPLCAKTDIHELQLKRVAAAEARSSNWRQQWRLMQVQLHVVALHGRAP